MSLAEAPADGYEGPTMAARSLGETPGVTGAIVCTRDGEILGITGDTTGDQGARDAALATFMVRRAEALTMDGDLRGLGRLVTGSTLRHIVLSGRRESGLCIASGDHLVLVSCRNGIAGASLLEQINVIIRRYL